MLQIQLLLSINALFVRVELLCSSIHMLPSNRENGVAVFGESPIRYNITWTKHFFFNLSSDRCYLQNMQLEVFQTGECFEEIKNLT